MWGVIPWTVAPQAPLSMEFSRQEYWSGLPFPSPAYFPTQGSNPGLLHCRQILYQLSYSEVHVEGWVGAKLAGPQVAEPGVMALGCVGGCTEARNHPTCAAVYLYSLMLLPPLGCVSPKENNLHNIYFCISCS